MLFYPFAIGKLGVEAFRIFSIGFLSLKITLRYANGTQELREPVQQGEPARSNLKPTTSPHGGSQYRQRLQESSGGSNCVQM